MRRKYESPKHPWDKMRIDTESQIRRKYGLKSKKEIWKAETMLRDFRREARKLQAQRGEASDREVNELIQKLVSLNLVEEGAGLDEVLRLEIENVLGRRLQTVVQEKGMATTARQARQFIKHGHIVIGDRRVTVPSYMVRGEEEGQIGFHEGSTVSELIPVGAPEAEGETETKSEA
jgi:small subunit ribosomal protein S4